MKDTVLLVVDVQTLIVERHPYNERKVIESIKELISYCRKNNVEVIYTRHDDGVGTELERGTDGWQIYYGVAPNEGEIVFDKKRNSAFLETGLKDYVDSKGIKNIILVGLQTEYCIDTTCKIGFEHGYNMIIPKEATSTLDNGEFTAKQLHDFYTYTIWNGRFAKVMHVCEVKRFMDNN